MLLFIFGASRFHIMQVWQHKWRLRKRVRYKAIKAYSKTICFLAKNWWENSWSWEQESTGDYLYWFFSCFQLKLSSVFIDFSFYFQKFSKTLAQSNEFRIPCQTSNVLMTQNRNVRISEHYLKPGRRFAWSADVPSSIFSFLRWILS